MSAKRWKRREVLGGALKKEKAGRTAGELQQKTIAKHRERLARFEALADELGASPGDVALAWVLSNPVVTSPIIGPRTMEHLTDAARALELELSDETRKTLDEIFPGPGGEAPEAYAW